MKPLLLALVATAALSTTATAGGFAVSFPTLTFPTSDDVTVQKECLRTASAACLPQG